MWGAFDIVNGNVYFGEILMQEGNSIWIASPSGIHECDLSSLVYTRR